MKTDMQHHDEPIDLGSAQVETRGILPVGIRDVEDEGAFPPLGIVAED